MIKRFTSLIFLLITGLYITAAPYNGEIMTFEQPDGTMVEALIFGDEFYARCESLDGYTLIRDDKTGWLCYAKLSNDKRSYLSTGIKYTGTHVLKSAMNIEKHLSINDDAMIEEVNKNEKKLSPDDLALKSISLKSASGVISGNYVGLTILVDFSDKPAALPKSEFEEMMNGANFTKDGNHGSVKQFYHDISNGKVNYENVVYGWFRAPKTFAEYEAMNFGTGARQLLKAALQWVDEQGFDFSTLSTNGYNKILAINLMHTGYPKAWSKGMWWHKGGFSGFSADGVTTMVYNTSPANSPMKIGTVCHENGHMLCGFPDTYKYKGGQDGLGNWDLMCSSNGKNPPPPNPLLRNNAGWGTEILITQPNVELTSVANDFNIYKYENPNDPNEFYLIENRAKKGRNSGIPDEGLTIWHIDKNKSNQAKMVEDQKVYVEHACSAYNVHNRTCFKGNRVNEFNDITYPSAQWHSGENSNFRIYDISKSDSTMTFKADFSKGDILDNSICKVLDVKYDSPNKEIERAIDKSPYASFICKASPTKPFEVQLDLGAEYDLNKLKYLPRYGKGINAIKQYELYISSDLQNWGSPVTSGSWDANDDLKVIKLNTTGRYIKLVGLSNLSSVHDLNISELYFYGSISSSSKPNRASVPSPTNNSLFVDTSGSVSWSTGDAAISHVVYISKNDVFDSNDIIENTNGTSVIYNNLEEGTTYFWRVDEVNANGIKTGDVWSFTTIAENVALHKPISSSSDMDDARKATFANDGDASSNESRWVSVTSTNPQWLEINLENIYELSGMRLYTGWDGYNEPIVDFDLQYWNGNDWENIVSVTKNSEPVFIKSFTNVKATKVRLYITKSSEDKVRLYELEIFGKYVSDCNGEIGGSAYFDKCDICVGGNTNLNECISTDVDNTQKEVLNIYPNPSEDGIINIRGLPDSKQVDVFNMLGQKVFSANVYDKMDVHTLVPGLYLIKVGENNFIKLKIK